MANVLIPKKSTVVAKQPTTSDLALGEIAINHADAKLFARHPVSGVVQEIGGGGSVTIDTTAADLLSFSSGTLSADDLGSDKIFFWDDSAAKATGLTVGTGLSISGTTLTASGDSVSIDPTAADVLTATSGAISADDAGADKLLFWDDSAGKLTHLELGTALSISGTTLNATTGTQYLASKTLARFTPRENQPPASAFATLDTRNSLAVLDFDAATDEAAIFSGVIPDYADLSSGLKIRLAWMATSATSGNVRWGVQLERCTTDLDADSFDTATLVTSAANGTSGIVTVAEITATALDSLAVGDTFRIRIYRDADDATNDTMTGDAELIAVEVQQIA
jgi:hypothetical protein